MSKEHLRRVPGKPAPPKKAEPKVSENPADKYRIIMPTKAMHPDTEIVFVSDEGVPLAKMFLTSIHFGSRGSSAEFRTIEQYYSVPRANVPSSDDNALISAGGWVVPSRTIYCRGCVLPGESHKPSCKYKP